MKRNFEDITFNATMIFASTCIALHIIAFVCKLFMK
jgi:hypothetical protein